jgi:hypothetical protein
MQSWRVGNLELQFPVRCVLNDGAMSHLDLTARYYDDELFGSVFRKAIGERRGKRSTYFNK